MSKVYRGILSCTQNTFSMLLNSVYNVTALITNCHKITNCDGRVFPIVAISDCRNLGGFKTQLFRLMPKVLGVHNGLFAEAYLGNSFRSLYSIYIHTCVYTGQIMPKYAKTQLLIFMPKVYRATLSNTQKPFSVWWDLIFHLLALITNCDKITNSDGWVSWYVAICDWSSLWGLKHNF